MSIYDFKTKSLCDYGFIYPVKRKNKKSIFIDGGEQMKKKTEKAFKLDDGKHEGIIKSIEYAERKGYEYIDILIEEAETKLNLRYGVPFSITENTALGQLLVRFGEKLEIDKECDVNNDVIKYGDKTILQSNLKVEFQTLTEKTDRGTFSNILIPTLKPKE